MSRSLVSLLILALSFGSSAAQAGPLAEGTPMLRGDSAATGQGWIAQELATIGVPVGGFYAPGKPDGTGIFDGPDGNVRILVNHELRWWEGYPYQLANGTELTGARVSSFVVDPVTQQLVSAGLAYDSVRDRAGVVVTLASQINERGTELDGFDKLCSARSLRAGERGFVDDLYFTGEENVDPTLPHGGSVWVLDVAGETLHAVPAAGRGAWENLAPLETGDPTRVALLAMSDHGDAPLFLYVGQKGALGDGSLLDRNGLAVGQLHVWVSDTGLTAPADFLGTGSVAAGRFVALDARDSEQAGLEGHDEAGFKNARTLEAQAVALGAFEFSRPEDVHENPADPDTAVLASTGGATGDDWGVLYRIDVDFSDLADIAATLTILHDADELDVPDAGIRNPDNLTWAGDGLIYVQEDPSIRSFGDATGIEASVWQLDPVTLATVRIAEMDRSAVVPEGTTDSDAEDLGDWESSGVLDVTEWFGTLGGARVLLSTVQAHHVRDGVIAEQVLDEGGQVLLLWQDLCPDDEELEPGPCGCGAPAPDTDGDGSADCIDGCPDDPGKVEPGACGCGKLDIDLDGDEVPDCACRPGDLFPDGIGDGFVTLADFAHVRRKAWLGTVPTLASDLECTDLDPPLSTCLAETGKTRRCPGGDGGLGFGDVVSVRRLLAGAEEIDCEPCLAGESASGPRAPADVAPAGSPDGQLTVADVLLLLRMAVGLTEPTPELLLIGDVAPSSLDGPLSIVVGDGVVDVVDVLLALRASVGLEELAWPLRELVLRSEDAQAFLAFTVTLDGWPAWAEIEAVDADDCEGGGGVDVVGAACTITCASDPRLVQGPADLLRIRYRAPEPVQAQGPQLSGTLLDDSLQPLDASLSLQAL